jgi:vacuolar iron transporter family protein
VVAASAPASEILVSGAAGLFAGAMSAGEHVSVSSQADTEKADAARETAELAAQPEFERRELQQIYVQRGSRGALALQVADDFMGKGAPGAHSRDEVGISNVTAARPIQAALTPPRLSQLGPPCRS